MFYNNGSLKCYFWTEENNGILILQKLNQLLQISFKGIETEIKIVDDNPIINSINNLPYDQVVLRGGYISGSFVKDDSLEQSMIDQLNSFFRLEKKTGVLLFTNQSSNQKDFIHKLSLAQMQRKYSKLTSQVQENITQNSGGGFRSSSRINRKKQLELKKLDAKIQRFETNNSSKFSMMFLIAGKTEHELNETYEMTEAVLFPFLQSTTHFPLKLNSLSNIEIENILHKISISHNPTPPEVLNLLPQEVALFCRFPSNNTLPITREQKTISQVRQLVSNESGISLGKVIDSNDLPTFTYYQNPKDLVLQSLITGTTGSGKTCTICSQIIRLEKLGIKSLIIDPKGSIFPILHEFLSDIQVFNFGKESVAPGRCNVLECPEWMDVQTHLNLVENILLSVLEIFPPMNMIIHRALTLLFNSDGWNVKKNKHGKNRTIDDLRHKINQITDGIGYSQKTHSDIKSALNMRLDYLTQGQISNQVNCQNSTRIEDLLDKTTIISLEYADSYAEKVVVLTFLGRLFVYFKNQPTTNDMKHYLIVDEAEHYFGKDQLLLYNDYEKASAGKAATKVLIEMIAQSRAFGLGIAISTQSPRKLSQEIMINSNTKIIHKTIDGYDISYLQKSMRLTDGQANMLPALKVGEAIFIDPNNPYPFKIKIELPFGLENAGKGISAAFKDKLMIDHMKEYFIDDLDFPDVLNNQIEEITDYQIEDLSEFHLKDEITKEFVEDMIKSNLPNESLLTKKDYQLLESHFFKRLFVNAIIYSFKSKNETPKNKLVEFLDGFLDFCQNAMENRQNNKAIIEFVNLAFNRYFKYNAKNKFQLMKKVIFFANNREDIGEI